MLSKKSLPVKQFFSRAIPSLALLLLLERIVQLEAKNHTWTRGSLLVLGACLLGFTLTGRLLTGGFLTVAVYLATRGFSELKFHYLEQPLRSQDFAGVNVSEVTELATNYPRQTLLVIGILLIVSLCTWRWSAKSRERWQWRLLALGASAFVLGALFGELKIVGVTSAAPESASVLSFIATFFQSPPTFESSLPPSPHEPGIRCPERPANLFLVLEESTFKPAGTTSQDVDMDFFDGNVFAGPLRVHVIGGTTHLTEFAWITGFPHTALKGENTFPQVPLAGRVHKTLPELLKACGYTTSVIYPSGRNFRNSAKWYSSVGFDHLLSGDELHVDDWRVRDSFFFRAAMDHLRTLPADKPHLIYVLTINQHGPHGPSNPRKDYMNRLHQSAEDIQELKTTLLRRGTLPNERPWVMSWFGDHRTSIETTGPDRWTTWGVITRLYTPEHGQASADKETSATDIAYLNRLLQREMGVSWQPFSQVQDELMTECRADFDGCSPSSKDKSIRAYIDMGGFLSAANAH